MPVMQAYELTIFCLALPLNTGSWQEVLTGMCADGKNQATMGLSGLS